jgi:hypothetical protein
VAGSFSGSLHLAAYGGGRRDGKPVERVGDGSEMLAGQMEIDGGVADVGVAKQFLDGGKVVAGFEQMSGIAVAAIPAPE